MVSVEQVHLLAAVGGKVELENGGGEDFGKFSSAVSRRN
jgi:hypothetical protein